VPAFLAHTPQERASVNLFRLRFSPHPLPRGEGMRAGPVLVVANKGEEKEPPQRTISFFREPKQGKGARVVFEWGQRERNQKHSRRCEGEFVDANGKAFFLFSLFLSPFSL